MNAREVVGTVVHGAIALGTIVAATWLAIDKTIDGATAIAVITALGATSGAAGARVVAATKSGNGAS